MKYQHPFYTAFTVKLLNAYERGKRIFAELIIMNRGRQILLKKYIDNIENDNIIVCGDFNDVPGCFAINTIADDDFDDVYRECGFGPMTTYHGSNLNFRIDHILYKGDFDATSFKRDKFNSSDHYPLYATFKWDND